MIDTYEGKLCCPKCHHLINIEESEPLENCPYCKKKLPQDNIEFWRHIAETREIKKRSYDDEDLHQTFYEDSSQEYHWWKASLDNTKQMKPLTFEMMQEMFDRCSRTPLLPTEEEEDE